jgi:hypothetical protein
MPAWACLLLLLLLFAAPTKTFAHAPPYSKDPPAIHGTTKALTVWLYSYYTLMAHPTHNLGSTFILINLVVHTSTRSFSPGRMRLEIQKYTYWSKPSGPGFPIIRLRSVAPSRSALTWTWLASGRTARGCLPPCERCSTHPLSWSNEATVSACTHARGMSLRTIVWSVALLDEL